MLTHRRALVALGTTVAVLGLPWAIEAYRMLWQATPWRQPAVPVFRLDTPRRTTTRSTR